MSVRMKPYLVACIVLFLIINVIFVSIALEHVSHGAFSPGDKHTENEAEYHHEAIMGNEQRHQEYHQQSPEESRAKLLDLATAHDLDYDGKISLDELQQWIFQSFQDLNAEDAQNKFQDLDTDEDGFVTWKEHLKDTWGVTDDQDIENNEDYKEEIAMIKEEELLFKAADRDEDGKLSQEEFQAFERPEQYDYMQPLVIKRTKEARDRNGDGYIDFHEYIVDIIPNYKKTMSSEERETYSTEKERFDLYFDADKDGRLDDMEIFRWLIPDDNATAMSEAEHIMEKSDTNRDGVLSPDEIQEHYQVFVGSEVTDYGHAINDPRYESHDEL
ncbi:calumenin-B-like [Paramacrobiotus metropolitanus]|uniref:calumenin-B-like n=1 Tax=Paramacrobiotus metropolitanus TaxID=2943436 RepID=UPI00244592DE|nr:calumenin-B-like [Paramacrobiotus metropolitanus]